MTSLRVLLLLCALLMAVAGCDEGVSPKPVSAPLSASDLGRLQQAEVALAEKRPAEVAALLAPLLARDPAPPRAHLLSGWAHYQMQHYGESVRALALATSADPSLAREARVLGFAHYKLGDHQAARDAFARYLVDAPDDYRGRYGLGLSELALGHHELAQPELERALELDPGYGKAHYALARLHQEQGRAAQALPHVAFVLEQEPFHVEALYLLSQVQKDLGDSAAAGATLERWQEAYAARERIGPLQQMVREGRAGVEVFLVLAREHVTLGDIEQARAALREGLHVHGGHSQLVAALATLEDD